MFELNLASLPNSVLYLEGVQLSYIKVYVHIFNLWHSHKPCFLSNPEFCKRTNLHKTTVIEAINFFEKNGLLKRIQKGKRRYLVQCTRFIEINEDVDNSQVKCSNDAHESELAYPRVGASLPHGSELDDHNNKYNNKINKKLLSKSEQKKANEQKHSWAESKPSPRADVTKQSTSWKAEEDNKKTHCSPEAVKKAMMSLPKHMRPKKYRDADRNNDDQKTTETTELSTGTVVQPKISTRRLTDGQGATIDVGRYKDSPSTIRGSNRLLEARRVYSFLEEAGLAGRDGAYFHPKS